MLLSLQIAHKIHILQWCMVHQR